MVVVVGLERQRGTRNAEFVLRADYGYDHLGSYLDSESVLCETGRCFGSHCRGSVTFNAFLNRRVEKLLSDVRAGGFVVQLFVNLRQVVWAIRLLDVAWQLRPFPGEMHAESDGSRVARLSAGST